MLVRWSGVLIGVAGGLSLYGQPPAAPDYAKDVRPIFERSCLPCHQSKGAGPFSFETLKDVRRHAVLIRTMALSGSMPPTPYASEHGALSLAPPLSDADRVTLQSWFRAGMPGAEQEAPQQADAPLIGERIELPALPEVRAEGAPYALEFTVPWDGAKTVQGFQWKSEAPLAVRRALLSWSDEAILPREMPVHDFGGQQVIGMLAPGYRGWRLPEGAGLRSGGKHLRVVLWLHPTGKPEPIQIAIHPEWSQPKESAQLLTLEHAPFEIKPNSNPVFTLSTQLAESARLVSVLPEARFSASTVIVWATPPGQPKKKLFSTVKWDPLWTGHFAFPAPVRLPKGTKIDAEFHFNNDERCQKNAGREPELIRSGSGKDDEICRLHLVMVP